MLIKLSPHPPQHVVSPPVDYIGNLSVTTPVFPAQVLDMKPANPAVAMPVESSALWLALDAVSADTNSSWIQFQPFGKLAIEVFNADDATFSIQLVGSCSDTPPDDSTPTADLGSAITEVGITFADYHGVRWVQVQASSVMTGSVSCRLSATAP